MSETTSSACIMVQVYFSSYMAHPASAPDIAS